MMGITYADIELIRDADLDFGAGRLSYRGSNAASAGDGPGRQRFFDAGDSSLFGQQSQSSPRRMRYNTELANGDIMRADVVGPVEVRFQNRKTTVNAVVIEAETEVLLGAIPMQGMDVMIDPKREQLIVNPDSPDKAYDC
jgi:hypothetical protein